MVNKLVVIGDSFCHGVGTVSPFKDSRNTHWSFGRYIARYLEVDYVNIAEPGIGIARTVELAFDYLKQNSNCVVLAGWTSPRRIGLYSDSTALQLLPSYGLLGDTQDTDVWVKEENGVKFVVNRANQHRLDMLAEMHRAAVENDLFEGAADSAKGIVEMFRAWCNQQGILLTDFNVFPGYSKLTNPKLDINFSQVMPDLGSHPTRDEQQKFAELYILRYGNQ